MAITKTYKNIIWDWNGTLLNDVEFCVHCINTLLIDRNIQQISLEKYKEIFKFPVKDYYIDAGFNFENEEFEIPAGQFIDLYNAGKHECSLSLGSREILTFLADLGIKQYILSASETKPLIEMLKSLNLLHFFSGVFGLDNHFASGKSDLAEQISRELHLKPEETILIGDTGHDAEIALWNGWKLVLYSGGHYSSTRLASYNGSIIIDDLIDIKLLFNSQHT